LVDEESKVDKFITAIPGEWKFNQQVVDQFDDHVKRSVPLYSEIQDMVIEMSEWFIRDGSTVYDIGSSTGETISRLLKKHSRKKNIRFIGIDNSPAMIEASKKKCPAENAQFLLQDITSINKFSNADFVVSLYTLQFLPLHQRKQILQKIYTDLSEGGALILVEKIRAEHAFLEDIWRELNWDFKRKQGLSDDMVLQKSRSLRGVLIPLTLTQNKELLKQVGFSEIDVFFKRYNFAGLIAVKTFEKPDGNNMDDGEE